MNNTYAFERFVLDPAHRHLALRSGEAVPITAKAFDALVYLVERAGHVVERDELIRAVWPGRLVEDNNLSQVVLTMRRALGDTGSTPAFVATVPRRGYQFIAEVVSHPSPVTTRRQESTPLPGIMHAPLSAQPGMVQISQRTLILATLAVILATLTISALLRGTDRPLSSGDAQARRMQPPDRLIESRPPTDLRASPACRGFARNTDECTGWREIESAFQRQRQLGLQNT